MVFASDSTTEGAREPNCFLLLALASSFNICLAWLSGGVRLMWLSTARRFVCAGGCFKNGVVGNSTEDGMAWRLVCAALRLAWLGSSLEDNLVGRGYEIGLTWRRPGGLCSSAGLVQRRMCAVGRFKE